MEQIDRLINEQEALEENKHRQDEIQEDTNSMEEKLEEINLSVGCIHGDGACAECGV